MIRPYRPSDLDGVMEVWTKASAVAHPFLSAEFQTAERHHIATVHLSNAETWVWESDGSVLGFIALLGNEVGAIFVHPRFHGTGIGRALMDHARKLRRELEVEVFTENAIGRTFYARYGFELIREKVHEQTGLGVMRLGLESDGR